MAKKILNTFKRKETNYTIEIATKDDYNSLNELLFEAFGDDIIRNGFKVLEYPSFSRSIILKDANKVISNVTIFSLEAIIRGSSMPCAGVGSVSTRKEYQKKGLCRRTMIEAFKNMKTNGEVISLLEPFDECFYQKFGYAIAEEFLRHSFEVKNLKDFPQRGITARKVVDSEEAFVIKELIRSMAHIGSRVLPPADFIKNLIKNGVAFIFENEGKPVGYIGLYKTTFDPKYKPEPFEEWQKGVHSSYSHAYTDPKVIPDMLRFIKEYCVAEGGTRIVILSQKDMPIRDFLKNRKKSHVRITPGFMIRIIDFERFCSLLKINPNLSCKITLEIIDKECYWNNGLYKLQAREGELEVSRTDENPDFQLKAKDISMIAGGLIPISSMILTGNIRCSKEIAKNLQMIFPLDGLFVYDRI